MTLAKLQITNSKLQREMRILVLMGGNSPERRVSLASGEAVAKGLALKGHQVLKMDPAHPEKVYTLEEAVFSGEVGEKPIGENLPLTPEKVKSLLDNLAKYAVDLVFPILHGGWGEDGRLQALFELAQIRFVGSGSVSSAVAMNKSLTKRIVSSEGILTPDYFVLPLAAIDKLPKYCEKFGFPLVIKPNNGGSTVGVSILHNSRKLSNAIEEVTALNDEVLVERYISGRELTVGIFDGQGMSVVEIIPKEGFYDYKHKYTSGQSNYVCPAEIPSGLTQKCIKQASVAFNVLGCAVFGRVDFRLNEEGKLYFLEVNTLPGMTNHSLVPKSASAIGMDFAELVNRIAVISMNLKR
jgi:D-alanine-D-alanine ligase